MFKWKKNKEAFTVEVVTGLPGDITPCNDPVNTVVLPKEPEVGPGFPVVPPDLSTKPKDIIGYCFGYACSKKHVNSTFDSITVDGYKERRVCQACGGVTKPAVVKRVAEAQWVDCGSRSWPEPDNSTYFAKGPWVPWWRWRPQTDWTKNSFVRFLEPDRRKK